MDAVESATGLHGLTRSFGELDLLLQAISISLGSPVARVANRNFYRECHAITSIMQRSLLVSTCSLYGRCICSRIPHSLRDWRQDLPSVRHRSPRRAQCKQQRELTCTHNQQRCYHGDETSSSNRSSWCFRRARSHVAAISDVGPHPSCTLAAAVHDGGSGSLILRIRRYDAQGGTRNGCRQREDPGRDA